MKNHAGSYDGFLYDPDTGVPLDVETFCNRFVDPVGVEAGQYLSHNARLPGFLASVKRDGDC